MFEWNKEKFVFNVLDAEMNEKVLKEEKKLWNDISDFEEKAGNAEGKLDADGIKAECGIIDSFFAALFGKEAPNKMFESKYDLAERTKALKKLYTVQRGQFEAHERRVGELNALVMGVGELNE